MERKLKCPGKPDAAGVTVQGLPGLSKSRLSACRPAVPDFLDQQWIWWAIVFVCFLVKFTVLWILIIEDSQSDTIVSCIRYYFFLLSRFFCHSSIFEVCCLSAPLGPPCYPSHTCVIQSILRSASIKHNLTTQSNYSCPYLEVYFNLAEGFVNSRPCPLFSIYINWYNGR